MASSPTVGRCVGTIPLPVRSHACFADELHDFFHEHPEYAAIIDEVRASHVFDEERRRRGMDTGAS
jgi:hypothetical protein